MFNEDRVLNDWTFQVDEISIGVYKAVGLDKYGHRVETEGTNPKLILADCKEMALKLSRSLKYK
jgi:hypothetical protein